MARSCPGGSWSTVGPQGSVTLRRSASVRTISAKGSAHRSWPRSNR
jgi:hypothetical protein